MYICRNGKERCKTLNCYVEKLVNDEKLLLLNRNSTVPVQCV